ncbi:MAG: hypothetical protein ABEH59_06730 [Halobacteriales archaeon]
MGVADTAAAEVRELHAFFEDWFAGERPRTDAELARLENALGGGFQLLDPEGDVVSRSAIIDSVEQRHGAATDGRAPGRIEVEAIEPRFERGDVCLLTYEEHQLTDGTWRGRRSSALFEASADAPGDLVWRHLHETWLPD